MTLIQLQPVKVSEGHPRLGARPFTGPETMREEELSVLDRLMFLLLPNSIIISLLLPPSQGP